MATKQHFGMDKAIRNKMNAKYDPALVDADTLHDDLKSGTVLCKAINSIVDKPTRFKESRMPFVQRENIVMYLNACKKLGMRETDLFVTQDLFEGDNIPLVVDQIHALSALCKTLPTYTGSTISGGIKLATKNERKFTAEQLNQNTETLFGSGSIRVEREVGLDKIILYANVKDKTATKTAESNPVSLLHQSVPVQREKKLHPNIRAPSATIGKGAALCTADISKTGESKSRNSGSSVSRAGASEEKKKLSIVEAQIAKLSVSSTSTFIPSSTTLPTPPPPPPAATAVTTTTAAAATATTTTTASTEKKRIKFCSECGNKFDIEKKVPKFCSECGTKVG